MRYLWSKRYIDWGILEDPLPVSSYTGPRNCSACTSPLNSNLCDICDSVTEEVWSYVQDKDGDTTYQTPYTALVVERASELVKRHTLEICQGQGNVRFRFVLTRPPGHHACSDHRVGFCHRNFAIDALDTAFSEGKTAVILDIDAHHGDGTETEIRRRTYGYYCSIHAFGPNIYPGTGLESDEVALNLPLHAQSGDAEWCAALAIATSWIKRKKVDLVILSCGFDGHAADTLVPLHLTSQAYRSCSMALHSLNIPVLAILEGGYHVPVLGECVEAILSRFILKA